MRRFCFHTFQRKCVVRLNPSCIGTRRPWHMHNTERNMIPYVTSIFNLSMDIHEKMDFIPKKKKTRRIRIGRFQARTGASCCRPLIVMYADTIFTVMSTPFQRLFCVIVRCDGDGMSLRYNLESIVSVRVKDCGCKKKEL